jgi:hypothetical protein
MATNNEGPGATSASEGEDNTTFKREGPPASNDTGGDVESMNRAAARSIERNVRPEPSDGDKTDRGSSGTSSPTDKH